MKKADLAIIYDDLMAGKAALEKGDVDYLPYVGIENACVYEIEGAPDKLGEPLDTQPWALGTHLVRIIYHAKRLNEKGIKTPPKLLEGYKKAMAIIEELF